MFEIKPVREHFEVYHNGNFYCSADTESEAEKEIESYKGDDKANDNLQCLSRL